MASECFWHARHLVPSSNLISLVTAAALLTLCPRFKQYTPHSLLLVILFVGLMVGAILIAPTILSSKGADAEVPAIGNLRLNRQP